jgi:hypothetical protein
MAELTDLDGVGPARSESLEEAGYASVEEVAEADPEELAEDADVPEDTALGFVVQAENLTSSEDAEVKEQEPVTQEIDEAVSANEAVEELPDDEEVEEEFEQDEAEPEVEEAEPEPTTVELSFEIDSGLEHDVFFAAMMRHKETMLGANRTQTQVFDAILEQLRTASTEDTITIETEPENLNELHNAIRKLAVSYQGDNLIDHMNAMKGIQNQVNEYRQEYLF